MEKNNYIMRVQISASIYVKGMDEEEARNDLLSKSTGDILEEMKGTVESGDIDILSIGEDCPHGGDITNDCEGCPESGDYHFEDGECVER